MRRLPFLLVGGLLTLGFYSCAQPQGPARPIAAEQLDAAAPVDVAATRQAVLNFLTGYARSDQDDTLLVSSIDESSELNRWARWLSFQNAVERAPITGAVERAPITVFLDSTTGDDGRVTATVFVDATVTFTQLSPAGESKRTPYGFTGQADVVLKSTGTWRVADITRNGASLVDSITVFESDAAQTKAGVTVTLDSAFAFPGDLWKLNLVMANRSRGAVTPLWSQATILQDVPGTARTNRALRVTGFETLAAGTGFQAILAFEPQTGVDGRTFELPIRSGSGEVTTFTFELGALVEASPTVPAPTAEASPLEAG